MENGAAGDTPVALSGVSEDASIGVGNAQLFQVSPSRSDTFPAFPEHHTNTTPHPFVNTFQPASHVSQLVVIDPTDHKAFEFSFPALVTWNISPAGQLFYFCFEFRLGLLVYSWQEPLEAVSQELDFSGIGYFRFLSVCFQE